MFRSTPGPFTAFDSSPVLAFGPGLLYVVMPNRPTLARRLLPHFLFLSFSLWAFICFSKTMDPDVSSYGFGFFPARL